MARSQKELAIFLSKLKPFPHPDRKLEQYPTDSNVAAKLLWKAHLEGTIQDKTIIDLGCGTGILGIGALILGAKEVIMVDTDKSIKELVKENLSLLKEEYEIEPEEMVTFKTADAESYQSELEKKDTTIVMNPPFGTSITHADTLFLDTAFKTGSHIYTMHKSNTTEHIKPTIRKYGARILWKTETSFMIKNTMKEHRKRIQRISVTIFHIDNS